METITATVEVEVQCNKCGKNLDSELKEQRYSSGKVLEVAPCEDCLEAAKEEGDSAGYDRGLEEGRAEGTS